MNRTDRALLGTAAGLTCLLAVQLAVAYGARGNGLGSVWTADWADNPESLEETVGMADEVLLGRVLRVRRGQDLVISVPGNPGEEYGIPTEVVTIQVERRYKSASRGSAETIEVFRTGASIGPPPSARGREPPEPPPPGARRPSRATPTTDRTVMLADDPPYVRGQRYVLMLRPGLEMRVDGQRLRAWRPVSPEGRYLVDRQNRLLPVSERAGFAREQRGRSLDALERQIRGGR